MGLEAVVFDFGGVLADEGFREGLYAIARRTGRDMETFYAAATETVYDCGYVTGRASEADFWAALRGRTGIGLPDAEMRREVLDRFVLRPWMIDMVRQLRQRGLQTVILSDQSDWLDELDLRYHFFREFDRVYNSYHLGRTKRDAAIFDELLAWLQLTGPEILFVDDNPGHIARAASRGIETHLFTGRQGFLATLRQHGLS